MKIHRAAAFVFIVAIAALLDLAGRAKEWWDERKSIYMGKH